MERGGQGGTAPPPPPVFDKQGHKGALHVDYMYNIQFFDLMLLHVHKDKTDNIDLNSIANQFVDVNER